jgi:hypothetical protein
MAWHGWCAVQSMLQGCCQCQQEQQQQEGSHGSSGNSGKCRQLRQRQRHSSKKTAAPKLTAGCTL